MTDFEVQSKELIDGLKSICANYGLGNDGNEFKIITQAFLYKFLNDKFSYELKKIDHALANAEKWETLFKAYDDKAKNSLLMKMDAGIAQFKTEYLISSLFQKQNEENFAKLFDDVLVNISQDNHDIFAVKTAGGARVRLFDRISEYIEDSGQRDDFARAIINKLAQFSFENIFNAKFDFFASLFEYLIQDYNKDSGGKYAEYYTPHSVAEIMANILVPEGEEVSNVTCYDPSAGSGSLLMSLAHAIGEKNCSIYSQDISQKSSQLLRLNLILNNLVPSIPNIIQGNTLTDPYHREGNDLRKFDYIVSNPPFNLDFSEDHATLNADEHKERFFAGIPNVTAKKSNMPIYLVFLQHVIYSLTAIGKAAIVVPTGFITSHTGIESRIIKEIVDKQMLAGVISMPSNIFATTGTNVSILFLDKNASDEIVLIDASGLGDKKRINKAQRTILSDEDTELIINMFNQKESLDDFSIIVNTIDIQKKNYSLSAGQYFPIKIEYSDLTELEFNDKLQNMRNKLTILFEESDKLKLKIDENLKKLKYEADE